MTVASFNRVDLLLDGISDDFLKSALRDRPKVKAAAKISERVQDRLALEGHLGKQQTAEKQQHKVDKIYVFLQHNSEIVPADAILSGALNLDSLFGKFKAEYNDKSTGVVQFKKGLLRYLRSLEEDFHQTDDSDFEARTSNFLDQQIEKSVHRLKFFLKP